MDRHCCGLTDLHKKRVKLVAFSLRVQMHTYPPAVALRLLVPVLGTSNTLLIYRPLPPFLPRPPYPLCTGLDFFPPPALTSNIQKERVAVVCHHVYRLRPRGTFKLGNVFLQHVIVCFFVSPPPLTHCDFFPPLSQDCKNHKKIM